MPVLVPSPSVKPETTPLARGLAGLLPLLKGGQGLTCHGVTWEDYLSLDELRDEAGSRKRIQYAEGVIQIMPPSFHHDRFTGRLTHIVTSYLIHFDIDFMTGGTTTLKRHDLERGLEPDTCFYIQHKAAVEEVERIDLTIHPAPDLAIEVDITTDSTAKYATYALLGVTELWLFDTSRVTFQVLQPNGQYLEVEESLSLPHVKSEELTRLIFEDHRSDLGFAKAVHRYMLTLS
jgi:Uma2 family endonuclease